MNNSIPNLNLASGTISIVTEAVTVNIPYQEHASRNTQLIPDLGDLNLSMIQAAVLKEELAVKEKKLREGRKRYAALSIQAQILEEEES